MAFLLAAMAIAGKAGRAEFTDEFVRSEQVQDMQRRISSVFGPEIEAMGDDRIRSRLEIETKDGRKIVRWADENYRGGPHNPLSDAEVEEKFRDCAVGLISEARMQAILDMVWSLDEQADVTAVYDLLDWRGQAGAGQRSVA